jgi:hypothetical protein
LALILVIILLLVLLGGYAFVGALIELILVILLVGAVIWFISIIGRGGRWWY